MRDTAETREQFVALILSRKAHSLPKTTSYAERERARLIVARAQGWLKSSFFRMDSRETAEHIAQLLTIRGEGDLS